jgi:ABC-2 type transport system permease protein
VIALLRKAVDEQRRSAVAWGIGLLGLAFTYAAIYPSIVKSQAALDQYMQSLPAAFRELFGVDYSSPAGYLRAELFASLGPLVFLLFAIGAGARAIGGEEEAGTLEVFLALPVLRRSVVLSKALTATLVSAALAAVLWVALLLLGRPFDLTVPAIDLAAACVMLWLLGLAFGAIALLVGAATGRRGTAVATTGTLAGVAYIVNLFGLTVSALEPFRPLSPFRWALAPDPLTTGLHPANVAVLLGIALVATALAVVAFERRDVG